MANVNIKNILLIGRTGNGKSTLANVLTDTNAFTESADSTSETRSIKTKGFKLGLENEKVKYCVIDTVGVGDTQLDTKDVLYKLGEVAHFVKENGLNQIFFVTSGRFTNEEVEAYKLLSSIIFDQDVFQYTTIIRTNFPEFETENACKRDRDKLRKESGELSEIFSNLGTKIIYVNNPPLVGRVNAIAVNKEIREESRTRLIVYLGSISHMNYMPINLSTLNDRISNYMSEKERLEKELKEKERMMKEAQENHEKKINDIETDLNKKLQEAEVKKDEEIQQLKNSLSEDIKRLEREGRASKQEIARLEKKCEEDKKRFEDDLRREKEINKEKANNEKQKSDDSSIEIIKQLKDEIKDLKTETGSLKGKVAEEVKKHIEKAPKQPVHQETKKDSVGMVITKTAAEIATLGTVSTFAPPVGAVLTAAWAVKKIFFS
jgi:hypothetical protein